MSFRWRMNFSNDFYKLFKMPYHGLFKYRKEGIILTAHYQHINLTELFNQNPDECLDLLERLEDSDIDKFQWEQVREVKEEFKELLRERE